MDRSSLGGTLEIFGGFLAGFEDPPGQCTDAGNIAYAGTEAHDFDLTGWCWNLQKILASQFSYLERGLGLEFKLQQRIDYVL